MFRLVMGFILGVIISRNAGAYATPFWGSILVFSLAGMWLFYRFGKRDVNLAVATAVAKADAKADAKAQAVASAAVQIFQMSGTTPSPVEIAAYVDHSEEQCITTSGHTSLTSSSEESSTKPFSRFRSLLPSQSD